MEILALSSKGVDKGWFQKRASILLDKVSSLEPRKNMTAIYAIPMGSMECYGPNRNADGWPRGECIKYANLNGKKITISAGLMDKYATFVTNGHVFKEHNNTDPKLASGEIVLSEWNPAMERIETISFVNNDEWDSELNKIASGTNHPVSMAAKVNFDICSACGNVSEGADDYCNHIKFFKNAILEDGHHICMVNEDPTFFDQSGVSVNADRLGFSIGIVDVGESKEASLTQSEKQAQMVILNSLSDMEKSLPSCPSFNVKDKIKAEDPELTGPIGKGTIITIKTIGPEKAMSGLANNGCILGPADFLSSIAEDDFSIDSMMDEVTSCLPTIFSELKNDLKCMGTQAIEPPVDLNKPTDINVQGIIDAVKPMLSLLPEDAEVRINVSKLKKEDIDERPVIKKVSSEVSDRGKEIAKEYGKYVLGALTKMSQKNLKPDLGSVIIRNRTQKS